MTTDRIFVGVARLALRIPGARSLKDGRRAVVSLRDRLRHRYEVTFHEVESGIRADRRVVVLTTAGNDQRLIRSILDQAVGFVNQSATVIPVEVDVDVFRWHPEQRTPAWVEDPSDG